MTAKKIAINGFGRIGRLAFRRLFEEKHQEIVAINDLSSPQNLAYLLEHDSAQGIFEKNKIQSTDTSIIVDGHEVLVFQERNPEDLPWEKLGIDLVIESTGFFRTKEKASLHLKAGAKRVVISAPAQGDVKTIVYGVNHKDITADDLIISAASCTTNCATPVIYALDKEFEINHGLLTTVHAATNDQRILDLVHTDPRRGRSVFSNIIPTHTGAAVAVTKVLPHLAGRLNGIALRIPAITGSIIDVTLELKTKNLTVEQINAAIKKYANSNELCSTLEYNDKPIVSTDVRGSIYGSVFDATITQILTGVDGRQLVKVFAWYDNEMSYVSQMIRVVDCCV